MEDDYHKFVKYKLNSEILSLKVKRRIINNKVQKITIDSLSTRRQAESLSTRTYVGNENERNLCQLVSCKKRRTESSTRLTQQNQSLQINSGNGVVLQDDVITSIQLAPVAFKMPDQSLKLKHLYSGLNKENRPDKRCWSALNLALLCLSEEPCQIRFSDCSSSISLLSDSYKSEELALSHALLLCAMAKMSMSSTEIKHLEKSIIYLVDSLVTACNNVSGSKSVIDGSLDSLNSRNHSSAYKLCKKLFLGTSLDLDTINISTVCCSSLKYLTDLKLNSEDGLKHIYGENTLKYVLGLTGKCTQEIVSSTSDTLSEDHGLINGTSHTINQCLQILEHTLSVNMDNSSLEHEDFSIHHCLTRLLGWSITSLFKEPSSGKRNSNNEFHRSTLVSNLKVLSVLSFDPHQYDTFTNVKGLMEKIMICILKTYFESDEKYFDILVLCLELMINFYLKNKRTFVQLCLKTFKVDSNEEIRAVEALIKMLLNCVNKIKEVKSIKLQGDKANASSNSEEPEIQLVLKAADKDMELSTIVGFISVLLVFFMDTKQSFKEFVLEKIPSEMFSEVISISKRFLHFASLTGGMPVTGIMILTHSIKRLEILNSS